MMIVWQIAVNESWLAISTDSGLAMKNMNVLNRVEIDVVSDQGALQ